MLFSYIYNTDYKNYSKFDVSFVNKFLFNLAKDISNAGFNKNYTSNFSGVLFNCIFWNDLKIQANFIELKFYKQFTNSFSNKF